jgi:hypothetical protein
VTIGPCLNGVHHQGVTIHVRSDTGSQWFLSCCRKLLAEIRDTEAV